MGSHCSIVSRAKLKFCIFLLNAVLSSSLYFLMKAKSSSKMVLYLLNVAMSDFARVYAVLHLFLLSPALWRASMAEETCLFLNWSSSSQMAYYSTLRSSWPNCSFLMERICASSLSATICPGVAPVWARAMI